MLIAKQDIIMPMWHSFSHIIQGKTQFYYCNDANKKRIATNVLAKLIFQDHTDQKSGFFQNQQPISWLCFHFSRLRRNCGKTETHTCSETGEGRRSWAWTVATSTQTGCWCACTRPPGRVSEWSHRPCSTVHGTHSPMHSLCPQSTTQTQH